MRKYGTLSNRALLPVLLLVYLLPVAIYGIAGAVGGGNRSIEYALSLMGELLLGLLALWALSSDRLSFDLVGASSRTLKRALWLVATIWGVFGLLMAALALFAKENILALLGDPALILQQWMFVGICEEFLFRGYLLNRLLRAFGSTNKWLGRGLALVAASVVFATAHVPATFFQQLRGLRPEGIELLLLNVALLFAAGLFFSYLYLRTGNLWLAALLHGGWNAPLIGTKGDFALAFVFIIVVEIARYIQSRAGRQVSRTLPVRVGGLTESSNQQLAGRAP